MDDKLLFTDKFKFDENVTECFNDMLRRSIPQYDVMREMVFNIGDRYIKDGSTIVDIGCSRGEAIRPFIESHGISCNYSLIDASEPMLDAARMNFEDCPTVSYEHFDIKFGIPIREKSAICILSILTVQFTPIEYRQKIMKNIYNALEDGGAFIFVEKVLGSTSAMDDMLVGQYYKIKREHSYTQEQIANKRQSLEGVLVPVTAKWNEDMLKAAGFSEIECFWRCLNFCGWIAVK